MVRLTETRRMTFYPMAGSVSDQFPYLLKVLNFIQSNEPSRKNFLNWFVNEFQTGKEFARKVFQIILKGCELVHLDRGKLFLTSQGREVLTTAQPQNLLVHFIKHFGGFEEMLEALLESRVQSATVLFERWGKKVASTYPDFMRWKQKYARAQFNHRLNWMRSFGFVEMVGGKYLLSSLGLKVASEMRRATAKSPDEATEISHRDLVEKMKFIGEFFQFEVRRNPSVNDVLPPSTQKLREERRLDCLWVRTVHFAGKIQYPLEIQIAGSIADTIERLEMVANFVQKAIIITDQNQKEKISDRLKIKRSPLLDKVIFVDIEDVDKIVEAATIMKMFTDEIFG